MANKNGESSSSSSSCSSSQTQQHQHNAHELEQDHHGGSCGLPPEKSGNAGSRSHGGNTVFKSGPLYISSKGLGWTSWKKRWFILTRTSLVFFRSDPNAVQQKGGEVNLTLGGIDLNNSGSVVVKADKRLLTVLFPDGRDGRAFTLKADTMEVLHEWKSALENALTQAPSASHVMGQNGIFRNDHANDSSGVDGKKDDTPPKSTVIGIPILLALEDVDGTPSFLEKALRFVEVHGVRIEGILRQAADVDDVEHRIREYEQGRNEFSPTEDAHIIADCLKYFLRELPSSPVPASCCNALLEACRTDRGNRVNAMREAICESFPEPNRRLLQRILMMMQTIASNKTVNRMNTNAVAACMAPLLLRPLLAGDCEIENDFDVGGDGSMQLLQAAAAANHAQAIVITLLEEYDSIFGEGSLSPGLYSDSEESGSETEEGTDDEEYDDEDEGSDEYTDEEEELENESNGSYSESANKRNEILISEIKTPKGSPEPKVTNKLASRFRRSSLRRHDDAEKNENKNVVEVSTTEDKNSSSSSSSDMASAVKKPSILSSAPGGSRRLWRRMAGKKNLSMEDIDFSLELLNEDDADIERLESTKVELQNKITEEVKNNEVLQASLEKRKKALYARRQALEKDVGRLQEELQQQRDRKSALESGLKGNQPIPDKIDEKLKKDLQEVAQAESDITNLEHKVDDLENRLGHQQDVKIDKQQDSRSKSSKMTGMSKRSGSKGEGNSTTSALSKLSMRLNFLKERRSQIANELLNMDKGRSSGQSSPSSGQNKSLQGSYQNQNQDKDSDQSPHVLDRGRSDNGGDRDRGKGSSQRTYSR